MYYAVHYTKVINRPDADAHTFATRLVARFRCLAVPCGIVAFCHRCHRHHHQAGRRQFSGAHRKFIQFRIAGTTAGVVEPGQRLVEFRCIHRQLALRRECAGGRTGGAGRTFWQSPSRQVRWRRLSVVTHRPSGAHRRRCLVRMP